VEPVIRADLQEDRYSRFRLIPWWDQAKIANCRLLVVGAGALGNEILKNASLLGFRKVVVVDLDRIEPQPAATNISAHTKNTNFFINPPNKLFVLEIRPDYQAGKPIARVLDEIAGESPQLSF